MFLQARQELEAEQFGKGEPDEAGRMLNYSILALTE